MIHILANRHDPAATEVVLRAFERSFTRSQVRLIEDNATLPDNAAILVALAPDGELAADFARKLKQGSKIIIFGTLDSGMADVAGIIPVTLNSDLCIAAECAPAPTYGMSESRAALVYPRVGLAAASPIASRSLCRFDFTNEWNNLGYGRIAFGGDRWSLAQLASSQQQAIAEVVIDGVTSPGVAATLRDLPNGALLWFARPVGPIDGPDWAVIESFISSYRAGDLSCRPFLRDIPHGCGCAVTARLDCDEDIASARPLFELYRDRGYPLSLAIKTDQPERPEHFELMEELRRAGGSILSHSVTHAPNWGGSAEAAECEARESKAWLERHLAGLNVTYAVSPFHQNPTYVADALARVGYHGFVGGIIANDPECMMARAGLVPFSTAEMVSHTQGCMLHGDCMLIDGDPIRIYKEAFASARDGSQFFGYLDHPFSERYAYGWLSEARRCDVHAAFLDHMERNSGPGPLLFINEETCLDFVRAKARARIHFDDATKLFRVSGQETSPLPLSISFHDRVVAAS